VTELIKSIVNLMKSSDIKHIVNIGTMGAVQGRKKYPGLSAYTSSKAALASLTELLYEELQPFGIKINYLALGAVETEMFNEAFPGSKAPLKPDDIASYIVNFALNNWRYINGKIIEVGL
jgi:NAD(P)-dependent dehydrogenase (short-subunit alcohol dehydrogenase family)